MSITSLSGILNALNSDADNINNIRQRSEKQRLCQEAILRSPCLQIPEEKKLILLKLQLRRLFPLFSFDVASAFSSLTLKQFLELTIEKIKVAYLCNQKPRSNLKEEDDDFPSESQDMRTRFDFYINQYTKSLKDSHGISPQMQSATKVVSALLDFPDCHFKKLGDLFPEKGIEEEQIKGLSEILEIHRDSLKSFIKQNTDLKRNIQSIVEGFAKMDIVNLIPIFHQEAEVFKNLDKKQSYFFSFILEQAKILNHLSSGPPQRASKQILERINKFDETIVKRLNALIEIVQSKMLHNLIFRGTKYIVSDVQKSWRDNYLGKIEETLSRFFESFVPLVEGEKNTKVLYSSLLALIENPSSTQGVTDLESIFSKSLSVYLNDLDQILKPYEACFDSKKHNTVDRLNFLKSFMLHQRENVCRGSTSQFFSTLSTSAKGYFSSERAQKSVLSHQQEEFRSFFRKQLISKFKKKEKDVAIVVDGYLKYRDEIEGGIFDAILSILLTMKNEISGKFTDFGLVYASLIHSLLEKKENEEAIQSLLALETPRKKRVRPSYISTFNAEAIEEIEEPALHSPLKAPISSLQKNYYVACHRARTFDPGRLYQLDQHYHLAHLDWTWELFEKAHAKNRPDLLDALFPLIVNHAYLSSEQALRTKSTSDDLSHGLLNMVRELNLPFEPLARDNNLGTFWFRYPHSSCSFYGANTPSILNAILHGSQNWNQASDLYQGTFALQKRLSKKIDSFQAPSQELPIVKFPKSTGAQELDRLIARWPAPTGTTEEENALKDAYEHLKRLKDAISLIHFAPTQRYLSLHERNIAIPLALICELIGFATTSFRTHNLEFYAKIWKLEDAISGQGEKFLKDLNIKKGGDYPFWKFYNKDHLVDGMNRLDKAYDLSLSATLHGDGFIPSGKSDLNLMKNYEDLFVRLEKGIDLLKDLFTNVVSKRPSQSSALGGI